MSRKKHFITVGITIAIILLYHESSQAIGQKPLPARSEPASTSDSCSTEIVSSVRPAGILTQSLRNEVDSAIDRGLDWLADKQKENGSWSNGDFPALTALAAQAFIGSKHPAREHVIKKAVQYILTCVHEDGGIYRNLSDRQGGGLCNYNTAICMNMLYLTKDPTLIPVVQNARTFIANSQHFGGDIYDGGFGYDRNTQRAYADLLNTYYSVEAMQVTAGAEEFRGGSERRIDIDWERTIKFIEQMQNKSGSGEENEGGFFYKPGESKAGTTTNDQSMVVFRSYGSITYAGLLSLIYAEISRNDPRVLSAFHWSARHWSLQENPGMGAQGMYFFYNILTKALHAYNSDLIPRPDGISLSWREEVAKRLVELQKVEASGMGYWQNDTGRFWENDPVLSTSYSLIALELL